MSQHNDILKFEIAAGIQDSLSEKRIVERIQGILGASEYDDDFVERVPSDCLNVAVSMRLNKDGLYGVSHQQLEDFIESLSKQYNLNPYGFN